MYNHIPNISCSSRNHITPPPSLLLLNILVKNVDRKLISKQSMGKCCGFYSEYYCGFTVNPLFKVSLVDKLRRHLFNDNYASRDDQGPDMSF